MHTYCMVELNGDYGIAVQTFPVEGNLMDTVWKAQQRFTNRLVARGVSQADIYAAIEEGVYHNDHYKLFLVWSES